MNRGFMIVTIAFAGPQSVPVPVQLLWVQFTRAVVVDSVADLRGSGINVWIVIVAIALTDHHAIGVDILLIGFDLARAIVVQPIAEFLCPGID